MQWFAQMRPVFRELYEPVVRFDQQQELSADSAKAAARLKARQALIEEVKAKIQAQGAGPTESLTHALPVTERGIRISSLPEPAFCIDLDNLTPSIPFDFEENYRFREEGEVSALIVGGPRLPPGTSPVSLDGRNIVAAVRVDLEVLGGGQRPVVLKAVASKSDEPRPRRRSGVKKN